MAYRYIGEESRLYSVLNSDIDRYRGRYKTYEEQLDGKRISISFVTPSLTIYDRFRFYILQHSTKKHLTLKNKYRPDYVSYEEYGTTNWWTLILYINDIPCIEEFDKDDILVPSLDCIIKLTEFYSEIQEIKEYNSDDYNSTVKPILYSLPADNIGNLNDTIEELTTTVTKNTLDIESSRFRREEFLMDIPSLRLRYIDLSTEPIENTINLTVKDKPSFTYGKHYKLIWNGDSHNRITWDPTIISGSGMIFRLKENDIIQVNYVAKS
jgi:hypothetical protein